MIKLEFPGEPPVKAQVPSLVGELNSYKPCMQHGEKKKKGKYMKDIEGYSKVKIRNQ